MKHCASYLPRSSARLSVCRVNYVFNDILSELIDIAYNDRFIWSYCYFSDCSLF